MDNQMLSDVAHLVSGQTTLLGIIAGVLIVGLLGLGWQLYATAKALQGIAASLEAIATLTAEVLRQMPKR